MAPNPGYGRRRSTDNAEPPGVALAATVGSWAEAVYATPRSTALMSTFCSRLKPCWPTYETSADSDHGSANCTPAFHWYEEGSSESYLKTISAGGPCVVNPPLPRLCSCEYL